MMPKKATSSALGCLSGLALAFVGLIAASFLFTWLAGDAFTVTRAAFKYRNFPDGYFFSHLPWLIGGSLLALFVLTLFLVVAFGFASGDENDKEAASDSDQASVASSNEPRVSARLFRALLVLLAGAVLVLVAGIILAHLWQALPSKASLDAWAEKEDATSQFWSREFPAFFWGSICWGGAIFTGLALIVAMGGGILKLFGKDPTN